MLKKACKNILLILLAISLFLSKNKTAEQESKSNDGFLYLTDFSNELTQAIESSVIVYATQDGFSSGKTGGGVIWKVDNEMCYIITCAHLFNKMDSPQINISPFNDASNKTKAILLGQSIDNDIAILYAQDLNTGEKTIPNNNIENIFFINLSSISILAQFYYNSFSKKIIV